MMRADTTSSTSVAVISLPDKLAHDFFVDSVLGPESSSPKSAPPVLELLELEIPDCECSMLSSSSSSGAARSIILMTSRRRDDPILPPAATKGDDNDDDDDDNNKNNSFSSNESRYPKCVSTTPRRSWDDAAQQTHSSPLSTLTPELLQAVSSIRHNQQDAKHKDTAIDLSLRFLNGMQPAAIPNVTSTAAAAAAVVVANSHTLMPGVSYQHFDDHFSHSSTAVLSNVGKTNKAVSNDSSNSNNNNHPYIPTFPSNRKRYTGNDDDDDSCGPPPNERTVSRIFSTRRP